MFIEVAIIHKKIQPNLATKTRYESQTRGVSHYDLAIYILKYL
jgi:hypothetical protein